MARRPLPPPPLLDCETWVAVTTPGKVPGRQFESHHCSRTQRWTSNPFFLILVVTGFETSKGPSRPGPWLAWSAMASGFRFDGLDVCEVIPKSGFVTCPRQNKHGESQL